jgi:hypothetical protein
MKKAASRTLHRISRAMAPDRRNRAQAGMAQVLEFAVSSPEVQVVVAGLNRTWLIAWARPEGHPGTIVRADVAVLPGHSCAARVGRIAARSASQLRTR